MKRKADQPTPVARTLQRYLEESGMAERMQELSVIPEWPGRVGPGIAAVTRPLTVSDGVLVVAVRSSAWLMELKLMERDVLRRLNQGRSRGRVKRIRFVMGEEA
ncbi:MAG: DUF721 domain-containing protein [Gemmatimonadetes bacterium]|nr:DUF721 domain-containing protein [Gemmatimonadota bacterium]